MLVALFVLFGSQTAWAAAPTISPAPDTILHPTEDEVGYSAIFTASDTDGDLESFDVINRPPFLLIQKNSQTEIELFTTIDTRPTATHVGETYEFWVSATDQAGNVTNVLYTITVEEFNDKPVIQNKIVSDTATQDEVYSFTFTVTDEENHPLSVNQDQTVTPGWLDVVPGTDYGQFTITSGGPVSNDTILADQPSVNISVQIDDDPQDPDLEPKFDRLEYTLNLINENDAPQIIDGSISSDQATEGQAYEHRFTVKDIDGDTITIERPIPKKPNWITVASSTDSADPPNTWVISGEPSNEDALSTEPQEIDILIEDGEGGTERLQYMITVQNLNDSPEQISGFAAPAFATQDEPYTHSFRVTDIDMDGVTLDRDSSNYPRSWMNINVEELDDNVYQFNISGTPENSDVLPVSGIQQKTELVTLVFTDDATITDPALEEDKTGQFEFEITYVNVNDAPKIAAGGEFPKSVDQGQLYEHTFTVTDADGNDLRLVDSGLVLPQWDQGMTLTQQSGEPGRAEFLLSGTPNWMDANQIEPYTVVIKIGDGVQGDEKFVTREFNVTVLNTNDRPEVTLHPIQDTAVDTLAQQNSLYSKPIEFFDKDDNTVEWIEEDSVFPAGMEVITTGTNNFEIRWTPTNDQVTDVQSADGTGLTQVENPYDVALEFCDDFEGAPPLCETVSITGLQVENVNDPPSISGDIPALVAGDYTEADPFIFTPVVDDPDSLFGEVAFTYTITGQNTIADWSFFDIDNGQLELWPGIDDAADSPYSISISVSDGQKKATLPLEVMVLTEAIKTGDFNLDGTVDLTDAILVLKILAGIELPEDQTFKLQAETDANNDDFAGLADVIYILNEVATP
jgi:hypothetical protein